MTNKDHYISPSSSDIGNASNPVHGNFGRGYSRTEHSNETLGYPERLFRYLAKPLVFGVLGTKCLLTLTGCAQDVEKQHEPPPVVESVRPPIATETVSPTPVPEVLRELRNLKMYRDGDFYIVKADDHTVARIGHDVWQGNADVYPPEDGIRAGHLWSEFLMFSPGQWLTDRVESEGLRLESFNVNDSSGEFVKYEGTWRFRNLFTTKAQHYIWADKEHIYHLVKTWLDVTDDISNAGAVWVELMNDTDAYRYIAAMTEDGVIERDATGRTEKHYLDGHLFGGSGWIAFYEPLRGQHGSPALVPLRASHPVRPRSWDGATDNIEIHMQDPRETRRLTAGDRFELEYLLIISGNTTDYGWVEDAKEKAKKFIDFWELE